MRAQLAFCLEGIVTQTLLPKIGGKGRAMAAEILVVTPAIRALIRDDKIHQIYSMMQSGKKYGMQTMNDALYQLYMSKTVALDEVLARESRSVGADAHDRHHAGGRRRERAATAKKWHQHGVTRGSDVVTGSSAARASPACRNSHTPPAPSTAS